VKWGYSILYYFLSSVSAFLLIKDTSFYPTWLGGSGTCFNIIRDAPALPEATQGMKVFYLFQFGKHFSRLFSHMFIRREGNYYEYVLHHALSTFLILFSYLTNQWLIGIMVLLCHDSSDFFLIIARGYKVIDLF
jgi:ceramide synthetase